MKNIITTDCQTSGVLSITQVHSKSVFDRLIFVILLIVGMTSRLQAQEESDFLSAVNQPHRIEFEINSQDIDIQIIPADEQGLLLVRQSTIRYESGFLWKLYLLDSTLNEVWSRDLTVEFGMNYLGYDFNGESFLLLFGKNQYKLEEMLVRKVDLVDGLVSDFQVNTVLPLELTHFEVVGHSLLFGGKSSNRPVVVFYNLYEKKPKVLPGIYNNKSKIVSIVTDDKLDIFTVVVNERNQNKTITLSLKMFTSDGRSINSTTLKSEFEKSLIDGVPTTFPNGTQYVVGTYSKRESEVSRGLYLAKLDKGEQVYIKYHSYGDLENFFSYLKDKQEEKMKSKIEKKKINGKDMKLNYRLMVHDMVKRGDEYIMIGEVYYPKYSSNTAIKSNFNDPYMNQPMPADAKLLGYNYTHAVVVGFNESGDVIWDNSFEINDVLVFPLIENVQVSVEEEKIVLMYAFENSLKSKIIKGDSVLEGKAVNDIRLTYEYDEVKSTNLGTEGIKKWYEYYFYAYGVQKIKNTQDHDVKLNRKVFYINKVHY